MVSNQTNLGTARASIELDASGVQQGIAMAQKAIQQGIAQISAQLTTYTQNIQQVSSAWNRASAPLAAYAAQSQQSAAVITASMNQIRSAALSAAQAVNSVPGAPPAASTPSAPFVQPFAGVRDAGGPGRANMAYLIGQGAQPELFVPRQNGDFIPNIDQVLARLSSNSGVRIDTVRINADTYAGGQAAARGFREALAQAYGEAN